MRRLISITLNVIVIIIVASLAANIVTFLGLAARGLAG